MSHVVTAAYVTLRVKDPAGTEVLQGFYEGAVLPDDINSDDLDRHVRKGMVAEAGTPEADAAVPYGKPVQFDQGGMPTTPEPAAAKPRERPAGRTAETKPRQAENKA